MRAIAGWHSFGQAAGTVMKTFATKDFWSIFMNSCNSSFGLFSSREINEVGSLAAWR
jgi:hypothetical protein